MKKLSKRTYILTIISVTMLIYFIGMYNYRKPVAIYKSFSNILISKPNIEKIAKIELNAKLYRGIYEGSIADINLHFRNRIEGRIIIGGKEYRFDGFTEKSKLTNIVGNIYENNQSTQVVFWFKMKDLDSMELLRVDVSGKSDYKIEAN
jgi:hypothetical protein